VNSLLDAFHFYDSYHNAHGKFAMSFMKTKTSSYVRWQKFFKVPTIKSFTWITGVIASKLFTRVIGIRLILIT